ncbi:DUF1761 domain-containing protein [Candidatus Pacearchaeota archaeon]|nr:DUF1761 domain-containing protein [Candidatus Pacearchaeota archaeon]
MLGSLSINHTAVIVSAVISFLIGWIWYSPLLFGNLWIKMSKFTKAQINAGKKRGMKGMLPQMLFGFLSTLVMIYTLVILIEIFEAITIVAGIFVAFLVWVGFIATTMLGMILWEGKPFALYLINSVHYLVVLLISSVILVLWW